MNVRAAGKTDTGKVREHNEDAFYCGEVSGLFAVADGMGGQLAGEIASAMAVDVLRDHLERGAAAGEALVGNVDQRHSPTANRLASGIRRANQVIHAAGKSKAAWRNMGSTLVAAQLHDQRLAIAHVGDSRIYLIRGGSIIQLTDDHSLVAEQQRQGLISQAEAERSPLKNIITRALGEGPQIEVDLSDLDLIDGDRILLCSDGLTNMVDDRAILAVVGAEDDPQRACDTLIATANAGGGRDNITVVLVYVAAAGFFTGLRQIFSQGR